MKKLESICIIDDDHIFVYGVKRLINEVDFCDHLIVYDNGQDALEGLTQMAESENKLPPVIFLDLNMPMMTGWEFLEDFMQLAQARECLVYIISSSVNPEDLVRINDYDVVKNYILKPVTTDDLKNILMEKV